MKITSTNQQIIKNPELSKADTADNLAGKKKPYSKVAADQSAAIKTDTVQLSQKSIDLARAARSDSGDNVTETEKGVTSAPQSGSGAGNTNKQSKADGKSQTNTVQNIDENVLAKLLKMADKRSVIFGSSGISSKTDGQEDAVEKSGKKIDFFL
ncbi:MAG: hypothetical protein ACUZ8N_11995 [Candidatus Scalindua sp.]